ncbi:MAG: chromate efflux transporter [Bacteroidia bacterium]|nr:chromate efflux transporter [Bacteroidia bacterium]
MNQSKIKQFRRVVFLLDVLKLALTAFGGPQVHFTQFQRLLVNKKKYLDEFELKELNSLCSMLPGPTSTQTITAIGYKMGGPTLAFLTLAIWVFPACFLMGNAAILLTIFGLDDPKLSYLKYLEPMASGFIIYAAYRFIQLFITRKYHWALLIGTAFIGITFQLGSPYLIPLTLLTGGLISSYINTRGLVRKPKPIRNIRYDNLLLFFIIFVVAATIGVATQNRIFLLFENNFRYGSIVFGGGNVLIPLMFNQFVEFRHYMEASEFLAGVGFLQAMPGPVFSIASFTGAMSMKEFGIFGQVAGILAGSIGIFLPGILLLFFVYPIWNQLKDFVPVKNAIEGINAASAGLVIASAYLLFLPVQLNEQNMIVLLTTLFLLLSTRVPSPIIVLACIIAGFIF